MKLIDIAMTVSEIAHLAEDDKIIKLLSRVENHIELTNPKLLLTNPEGNVKGVGMLYQDFAHFK